MSPSDVSARSPCRDPQTQCEADEERGRDAGTGRHEVKPDPYSKGRDGPDLVGEGEDVHVAIVSTSEAAQPSRGSWPDAGTAENQETSIVPPPPQGRP
jgi:hypothetical protein